jgi:hypothetical protein
MANGVQVFRFAIGIVTRVRCDELSGALLQSCPVSARYYRVAALGPGFPAQTEGVSSSAIGQVGGADITDPATPP